MESDNQNILEPNYHSIDVGGQTLHYISIGKGSKLVLAFHGYANSSEMFRFLEHPDFTILSFDLPFQGKSDGVVGHLLTKDLMKSMVKSILTKYNVSTLGLVGFSLGARICLCITEQMPENIRNIVLIAPDGIRKNVSYNLLTNTSIGRSLFRSFVHYGTAYIKLFSLLHQIGLINRSMFKFAMQYIRTEESRQMLYNIWISTSKLIPDLLKIKKVVRQTNISFHLLMGQQDQVIPVKNALQFKANASNINLHVFERGHNLLDFEEVRGTVAAWLFRINQSAQKK